MVRSTRQLVVVVILLVAFSYLSSTSLIFSQTTGNKEHEPNNQFGNANLIAATGSLQATIDTAQDVDWFQVTVDHQGELRVGVGNVAAGLDLNVRVWNANKDAISNWFAPLAKGGDTTGFVDLPAPGRYLLEVSDGGYDAASEQPYQLQLAFTPSADNNEPNDRFGQATSLAIGQAVDANILPQGESDWYTLVVNQQGELQLAVRNVASDLDINLRVWNANKDAISNWIAPLAKGGDTTGFVDLPAPGRYYLEVADGGYDARSTQPYRLQANFIPAMDANEPNDSFGTAASVPFSTSVAANILPIGESDWFRFDVDHHGELGFVIRNVPENLDINLRVWNANRDAISNWFSPLAKGGNTTGFVDLPAPGRYLLEMSDGGYDGRSSQPFSITLAFTRAVDGFEPNNSFGTASELGIDRSVQTNILPQAEVDWHSLEVTHQGELQITASDVPANLDINLRVWNANKDAISNWFAPLAQGGDTSGVVDLPTAGRYYLEVTDGGYDARSIQPFTLTTEFIAAADQGEPNNTLETAAPVSLDTTIPANILPANDADWCRLEITSTGELHVLITNVAPELELAMRLWNEEKQTISDWKYPVAPGGNTEAIFPIEKTGIYYLEVVDNRVGRSIQPYLLRFSMQPIDPASVAITETLTTTTTILTDTTAITVTKINVTYVITTVTGVSGTTTSMQAITTTEVVTLTEETTRTQGIDTSSTPTVTTPVTSTQTLSATNNLSSTGNLIIRTSGQVGPLGSDLFVYNTGQAGVDGARLSVLPGSLAELVTINLATSDAPPPGLPFGLFPAGLYWQMTPAGLQFSQPVTLSLPLPSGATSESKFFVGHWNGTSWENLGGTVANGLISAQTSSFSSFGVFCGELANYRRVRFVNETGNKLIVLRYVSGPTVNADDPHADLRGQCPPPQTSPQPLESAKQEQRFEDVDAVEMLLWPGSYQFVVSYPTPQPGVAVTYFVSLATGDKEETIHIATGGLTGDDPATQIVTGSSNGAPVVACDAVVPAGVAKTILNPRLVVIGEGSPLRLEQLPPNGEGILFRVTASDPEGTNLRQLWSNYQGGLPTVDDLIASGATASPHHFQFRPTQAGEYDLFVTLYDAFDLFAECRYHVVVAANTPPVINVFAGRVQVEFGRLEADVIANQAFALPAIPDTNPPASSTLPSLLTIPSHLTAGASVAVTNTMICPTALIGRFVPIPQSKPQAYTVIDLATQTAIAQINKADEVIVVPAPVNALLPPSGSDATDRWQYPGYDCVWAVIGDADEDPQQFRWELPEPVFGKGTVYTAVAVPSGYHSDAPGGIPLGTLIRTYEQLTAYNALVSDLYNLWGVVPAILWEAWDDPCLVAGDSSQSTQNPCESPLSRGGVTNLIGYTTDTFAPVEQQGYTPIAVAAEGFQSDCANLLFILALTPNPSDPAPKEGVEVTAQLSPVIENCSLHFHINGTDGYSKDEMIPSNLDGKATFWIPGGAEEVVDVVTAGICRPLPELANPASVAQACETEDGKKGELIQMQVTYRF